MKWCSSIWLSFCQNSSKVKSWRTNELSQGLIYRRGANLSEWLETSTQISDSSNRCFVFLSLQLLFLRFLSFFFNFWVLGNRKYYGSHLFFGDLNADRKCSFKHKACCFRIISKRGCWKWPFSDSESRWEKVGRLNGKLDADRDSKERERANMQRLPPLSTCSPNSIFSPNSFPFSGGSRAESTFPFSFPAQISTVHHFLVLSTPLTRSENLDWKTFIIFLPLTSYPIYSGILF